MGCSGCKKGKDPLAMFDRHGNRVESDPHKVRVESDVQNDNRRHAVSPDEFKSYGGKPIKEMTVDEIIEDRKKKTKEWFNKREEYLSNLDETTKWVIIRELVDAYNGEELVPTTLSSAKIISTLWYYSTHPAFEKIIRRFPGLEEQIKVKYDNLKKERFDVVFR